MANCAFSLEEFLVSLPGKISQARRQLYSYNDNILEYWMRRLEDYLNVLNVFYQRVVDADNNDDEFSATLLTLLLETQNLHQRFEEALPNNGSFDVPNANCENEADEGGIGRPRKNVLPEEVNQLFTIYQSWTDVAKELGISVKTLYRRRLEFGMDVSTKTGPRNYYSKICNEELYAIVRETLDILPDAGESYIIGAFRSRGINVQRQRIREGIMHVDTISRALRRTVSIVRRKYNVQAPNSLWYIYILYIFFLAIYKIYI